MFFELTDHTKPEDGRPHFGFLIAKNPASPPFERALGGGSDSIARRVVGRYLAERPNTYSITVDNDELAWMQKLKDANQPHYVSAAPFVVSPTNLKGIGVALKSALDGKDTAKGLIPEGEMARPRAWSAVLGPFALPDAFVLDVYRGLGLSASIAREGGEEEVTAEFAWLLPYSTSEVCTVILGCNQELFGETPFTEFLQKVLVGAYALTVNQHPEKYLADSLVASLMEASKAWLGKVPAKDRIIQRLSQGSTDVARQWAEAIRGDEENEEGEGEADQKPQFASLHARRHEVILREVPLTQEGAAARSLRVIDLLNADLGFTREARSEACRRIAEVARVVGEAEVLPVVAAVSPYRDDRHRARQRFDPGYFIEVHVHAPLALCEQRDPKGLYRRARAGEIVGFTGVDDPYEEPASPELLVDTQAMSLELATRHVFSEVVRAFTDRAMGRTRR